MDPANSTSSSRSSRRNVRSAHHLTSCVRRAASRCSARPPAGVRSLHERMATASSCTPRRTCVGAPDKKPAGSRRHDCAPAPCRRHSRRPAECRKSRQLHGNLVGAAAVGEHIGDRRRRRAAPWAIIDRMRPELADAGAMSPRIKHRASASRRRTAAARPGSS